MSKPDFCSEKDLIFVPRQEWIYNQDGITLPGKGMTLLVGPSGIGKSYMALHWALSLAQVHRVVYVAAEKFQLYPDRCRAWYQYYQLRSQDNLFFYTGAFSLLDEEATTHFTWKCNDLDAEVVIIDTLARCMVGGDENSTRDMSKVIANCEYLKNELGCALILVHHSGKSSRSARGSSALIGAVDCEVRLSKSRRVITLKNTKQSGTQEFPDVKYRLTPLELTGLHPSLGRVINCVLCRVMQEESDGLLTELTLNQLKVLKSLEVAPDGLRHAQLKESLGLSASSLGSATKPLVESGYVHHVSKGPYQLTDHGKEILQHYSQS